MDTILKSIWTLYINGNIVGYTIKEILKGRNAILVLLTIYDLHCILMKILFMLRIFLGEKKM